MILFIGFSPQQPKTPSASFQTSQLYCFWLGSKPLPVSAFIYEWTDFLSPGTIWFSKKNVILMRLKAT